MASLATWNVGGPQRSKWSEFVTFDTQMLEAALDKLFETDIQMQPAVSTMGPALGYLLEHLKKYFPTSVRKNDPGRAVALWYRQMCIKTVTQAFRHCVESKDALRAYSWGDRYFSDRPTVTSSDPTLEPSLFDADKLSSSSKYPNFSRFEKAWLAHVFAENPDGGLVRLMPVNKYMANSPLMQDFTLSNDDMRVVSYMNLFFYDWCLTYFVWCLRDATNVWAVRETALSAQTHLIRWLATIKALSQHGILALQEVPSDLKQAIDGSWGARYIHASQTTPQSVGLLVPDPKQIMARHVLNHCWSDDKLLASRTLGIVYQMKDMVPEALCGSWMIVSAHLKPEDLDAMMAAMHSVRTTTYPDTVAMVIMGDLNYTRPTIQALHQTCVKHEFVPAWDPAHPIPDTVDNVRSNYLQPQLAKGGIRNAAPKDHVLIWTAKSTATPTVQTAVVVDTTMTKARPGEPLVLDLPSDHAPVVVHF